MARKVKSREPGIGARRAIFARRSDVHRRGPRDEIRYPGVEVHKDLHPRAGLEIDYLGRTGVEDDPRVLVGWDADRVADFTAAEHGRDQDGAGAVHLDDRAIDGRRGQPRWPVVRRGETARNADQKEPGRGRDDQRRRQGLPSIGNRCV